MDHDHGYRRLIDIRRHDAHRVTAWMEDDFHHFGVRISHDEGFVTDIGALAVRAPWSTCPAAQLPLRALIGQQLITRASDVGRLLPMRLQCTHMFDLAGLALAVAACGTAHRVYEATVSERRPRPGAEQPHRGRCSAALWRNGQGVLNWEIADETIISLGPQQSLLRGFRLWTESLPEAEAEAATVLRRAVDVSAGRFVELDQVEVASDLNLPAVCYSYQPEQAMQARRNFGTTRSFSESNRLMLAQLDRNI